jgi:tetratricopeptide (TPR) repeat protein
LASVPGVPDWLAELVTQLLRKAPAERPQSAREVLSRLDRASATFSGAATAMGAPTLLDEGWKSAFWHNVARRWKFFVPAAAVAMALLAGLLYLGRTQALAATDYILLPEFVNTTGEAVFDGTLKEALAVKLQESPFLNVVSEDRIRQTLRFMGRPADERVTPTLAREICQRQGVKAMVSGQIAPLGSHYVIALNALNCQTGDSLARGQVEAASKEQVLRALGTAASDLRGKLGESLSSIRKFDVPIEQATTASLEALKAYALANRERARGTEARAIPFFQRAIELDPNFAMAHAQLGTSYGNLGQSELSIEHTEKAFELRDRVSESERLYLISHHYEFATGELEKAIETYQLWKQTYPRDFIPWNNLASSYSRIGMFEKAVGEAQEACRLEPNQVAPCFNIAAAFFGLNRFEEAKAICEQQTSKGSDSPFFNLMLYSIAFIQGDATGMERQLERLKGKPGEEQVLAAQAGVASFSGKMQKARELNRQFVELTQRHDLTETAARRVAAEALAEAAVGNSRQAREQAAVALGLAPRGIGARVLAAEALAVSGQPNQALELAHELELRYPRNTLLHELGVPLIRAMVEGDRGNLKAAIELLQATKPYELGFESGMLPIYVRGRVHLRAGAGREAAAEFQKILDHRGVSGLTPIYPLSQLGLARAHALAGDSAQSRKAYQDFLALWKDADPDLPVLQQAKAEYAKLSL